jgi:ATP-binding cassette subfamily B protein
MSNTNTASLETGDIKKDSMNGGDAFGDMVFQKPKSFWKGMGLLIRYLRPWSILIIISIIFTIASTIGNIVAPNIVSEFTDAVFGMLPQFDLNTGAIIGPPTYTTEAAMKIVRQTITLLVVLYAAAFVVSYAQALFMASVAANSTKKMRNDISVKINRVPLGYYDKVGFGDVLSRTTNDISTIGQSLNEGLVPTISSLVLIVGLIVVMFFTSWQMALVTIATVPVSFVLIGLVMSFSQRYQKMQRDYLGKLNSQIEENFSAQSVVLAYRGQHKAQTKFETVNKSLAVSARKAEFLTGLMFPLMGFVGNIGLVAVLIAGIVFLNDGTIGSAGVVVQFLLYSRLFMQPFGQLAQGLGLLQSGVAGSERVFEFLNEKEQPYDVDKPTLQILKNDPNYRVKGDVRFENVRFGYDPDKPVIKNFSESIHSGQKIAIVGPTGAGKTTIINLLMRFYEPQSGGIYIDGVHSDDMPRSYVRGLFGMVLQDTWLFEGTIKENLIYAKKGVTDEQVYDVCKAVDIHHFIMTLEGGYDFRITDEVNISVGQRQLLTIARAMVQDNPILILDEATSNVDTRTEQHIQDAMDKVSRGRTSFVIAHRLSTIKNADKILVLRDGDVIESGSHDELIAQQGFYEELYNSQFADAMEDA